MSIKETLTNKDQWAAFIGHMMLGMVVLWPIIYASVSSVAQEKVEMSAKDIKHDLSTLNATVQDMKVVQQRNSTNVENIQKEQVNQRESLRDINGKLDRLIERESSNHR